MKTEADLQDNEPRIVSGVKGVKSRPFSRKFANATAMEKWMDANEGDIEIFQIERA